MNTATLSHREIEILRPLAEAKSAELARDLHERRRELVRELEALDHEEWKTVTPLETKAGESLARLQSCERAYSEAKAEAETWAAKVARARWDIGHRRDRLTNELASTAPSEITEALLTISRIEMGARNALVYSETRGPRFMDGTSLPAVRSNSDKVEAVLAACRLARRDMEKLLVSAMPPDELAQHVEAVMVEVRKRAAALGVCHA